MLIAKYEQTYRQKAAEPSMMLALCTFNKNFNPNMKGNF